MEDNYEQRLKFENSILSFEDSDKKLTSVSRSSIEKDDYSQNNKIQLIDDKSGDSLTIHRQLLTRKSHIKLWTTLILIILSLIFVPFYSIAEHYLISLEKSKLINSLDNFASYKFFFFNKYFSFFLYFFE